MCSSRISKEFMALRRSKPWDVTVTSEDDNLHQWVALLPGPKDTPYEGSTLKIRIILPSNYPYESPTVNLITPIYHLNVSQEWGHVCLGITSEGQWEATDRIEDVLNSLYTILQTPQADNAADQSTLETFIKDRKHYDKLARLSVTKAC